MESASRCTTSVPVAMPLSTFMLTARSAPAPLGVNASVTTGRTATTALALIAAGTSST